jgi:ketosteroid isomerase-like protein
VLADDMVWFIPTSDPARQFRKTKQDYIEYVTNFQHRNFLAGSRVEIFAHTAQGNRVATEMISDITFKDGSPYRNRYHQLFKFNDVGRVVEYRLYQDSAVRVDDAIAACERLVVAFVVALSSGAEQDVRAKVTDEFRWYPAAGSDPIDGTALFAMISRPRAVGKGLGLKIIEEGIVAEENVASVEVASAPGVIHSLVIARDGNRIASVAEFSSGKSILEITAG